MSRERSEIQAKLSEAVQRWGNLNVLYTHEIASHIGLGATDFECWSLLRDHGTMTAGRLAQLSGLTTGAVTGLIDRLERAGLATRQPHPADRRRVMVQFVENAATHAKVVALYRPVGEKFDAVVSRYTDAELETIYGFINQCVEAVGKLTGKTGQAR